MEKQLEIEKECTFKPKINKKSSSKRREVTDLMRWENQRRHKLLDRIDAENTKYTTKEHSDFVSSASKRSRTCSKSDSDSESKIGKVGLLQLDKNKKKTHTLKKNSAVKKCRGATRKSSCSNHEDNNFKSRSRTQGRSNSILRARDKKLQND